MVDYVVLTKLTNEEYQIMTYIILGIIVIALLYLITSYNNLIKKKNLVEEGWSSIDVQLKRRSNLIPNILSSVKGYMSHFTVSNFTSSLGSSLSSSISLAASPPGSSSGSGGGGGGW